MKSAALEFLGLAGSSTCNPQYGHGISEGAEEEAASVDISGGHLCDRQFGLTRLGSLRLVD